MSNDTSSGLSRRSFLKALGAAGLVATTGGAFLLPGSNLMVIPNAKGFLVVDMGKCMGCNTCMTTCSLTHHGTACLSLARIQILQDPFAPWPDDITMAVCHQCEDAPCVKACPVHADYVDGNFGNVRTIDPKRCIGCLQCLAACPWVPKRLQWNPTARASQKCDLCANTPYLKEKGGPGGVQSCVRVCPMGAIAFVDRMPDQKSKSSYNVNLRGKGWELLGGSAEDIVREG